ncbi:MAG: hypothetical protein K0V04_15350, partial [Deltaproteobacteria bacterium]|nr:hypothetical protein [Deltaproteobacteria bacterium]
MKRSQHQWTPCLLSLGLVCAACVIPVELLETDGETATAGETGTAGGAETEGETETEGESESETEEEGRLLGLRLSAGGVMEVLTIDLGTGAVSTVGQFGGLYGWYPEAALSPDRTALYLVGSNSDDVTNE